MDVDRPSNFRTTAGRNRVDCQVSCNEQFLAGRQSEIKIVAGRPSEIKNFKSVGTVRWSEPPSALEELRESKSKAHSAQRGQVDLGVTEADIDAVLTSVRYSLARPFVGYSKKDLVHMQETELPDIAGASVDQTLGHSNAINIITHPSIITNVPDLREQNYGAVDTKPSNFQPSKPFTDSRVSRAAVWMGVMFAFVFVASYSMSENMHKGGPFAAPKVTAQELAAGHLHGAGAGKNDAHGPISASLRKAAAAVAVKHSSLAHSAAAASAHAEGSSPRKTSSDSAEAAIVRAEERRMAKAVDASNDRMVRALLKRGA